MDASQLTLSSSELYARLGTASAPVLIDVRGHDAFVGDDRLIMLKHGLVIYDALNKWCRLHAEKHRSTSKTAA